MKLAPRDKIPLVEDTYVPDGCTKPAVQQTELMGSGRSPTSRQLMTMRSMAIQEYCTLRSDFRLKDAKGREPTPDELQQLSQYRAVVTFLGSVGAIDANWAKKFL